MSSGFGAGFTRGLLVSAVAAAALSLVVPLPPVDPGAKSQVDLTTPRGSGFDAARHDTSPVLPRTDQSVAKDSAPVPEAKPASPVAPRADTSPARQPDALGEVAALPNTPPAKGEDLALKTPKGDSAPASPPPALGVPMPAIDNPVSQIPAHPAKAVANPPTTELSGPPNINQDGSTTPPATPTAMPAAMPLVTPAQPDSGAIRQNRVAFENPKAQPLFSIVLIDAGSDGLDDEVLRTFTIPITFALDPDAPGATARAKRLRAAGFEILALAPKALVAAANKPDGDIAPALNAALARLPEAVGLLDRIKPRIEGAPRREDQLIADLKKQGLGLLTYDIGKSGANLKARHAGVFAGTVYRILDSQRESGTVIKRYLDRAVLEAGKTGKVIVVGHSYPETVTALFSWAISSKSARVALAPVSASLLGQ